MVELILVLIPPTYAFNDHAYSALSARSIVLVPVISQSTLFVSFNVRILVPGATVESNEPPPAPGGVFPATFIILLLPTVLPPTDVGI